LTAEWNCQLWCLLNCLKLRIIWGTSDEGASASFARMCRIRLRASRFVQYRWFWKLCRYFNHELLASCRTRKKYLKNSMSKNKMTFYYQVKLFSECSKRPMLFGWFWSTSARNLRSQLTVAFEVSEFKKYITHKQYNKENQSKQWHAKFTMNFNRNDGPNRFKQFW
jgi:hypothetical protein